MSLKICAPFLFLALTHCGGGGGGGGESGPSNGSSLGLGSLLTANEEDIIVAADSATIELDLQDLEQESLSFVWQVTAGDQQLEIADYLQAPLDEFLSNSSTAIFQAPVQADEETLYTITVTVTDNNGKSETKQIEITVLPTPQPTAFIGHDEAPDTGYLRMDTINLDASGSSAGADATLSGYQWQLAPPTGSNTTVLDADQVQARFIPDIPGDYTVTLTVTNSNAKQNSRDFLFSVINQIPTVSLSPTTTTELNAGGSVVLKASAEDGDGDTLQYHWLVTLAGDTVDVTAEVLGQDTNALLAMNEVTFTAPDTAQTRDYLVQLTVKDSHGAEKIVNAPNIRVSPMPTANIQPSPATNTQGYARHALITLDGSNSAASEDGASISAYQWSLTRPQGSAAAISDATQSQVSFTPDLPGAYTITLDVSDTLQRSHSNSVTLTAFNKMPSATLSPTTTTELNAGGSVVLKASAEDGDGDTLQYHWLVTLAGDTVDVTAEVLGQDTNALLAMNEVTFTAPETAQMQDYLVQLTIRDGHGAEKIVNAPNIRVLPMPTANIQPSPATNTQGYARHALITLDGSNSAASEDGASISAYQWSLTRPQGSAAAISDATQSQVSFTPDLPGAYTITLDVSDTLQRSHSNSVTLTAFNKMPSATLSPSTATELNAGGSVVLKASAEDGDGDTLQYHWLVTLAGDTVDVTAEVLGQDANALLAMNEVTFTAPETEQTRDYLVQLTVKDSHGAEKIVNAPNIRVSPMPTANIQPSPATNTQGYARHALITLDGSNSAASEDGASISAYQWSLTRPQGSAAAISDATQSQVSFTPDLPGAYTITLDVSDTLQRSHSNSVTLTAFNKMPSATLSPSTATELNAGGSVVLKASAEDGDGDTLQYHWLVTLAGGTVDVTAEVLGQDANALLAMNEVTFTAPDTAQMQDYLVQLTIRDGHGGEKIINAPNIRVSPMPTANIQPSPATNTQGYARHALITLDGSNSAASEDGASISAYQWSLTRPQGSAAAISDATQSQVSFTPDLPGAYTITLDVSDTLQRSHSNSVTLTAFNKMPSATLSPSTATEIANGESVVIKASAEDGDGDTLQYHWLVTLAGDTVDVTAEVLGQDVNALLAMNEVTFTAPDTAQAQDYLVQLTIRDGHGGEKIVNAPNIRVLPMPTANIQPSQPTSAAGYARHALITLDGSNSAASEDGASISAYQWSLTRPQGSAAAISDATQSQVSFTPDLPGAYTITLDVSDTLQRSHSNSVTLTAFNKMPSATLSPSTATELNAGGSVVLKASAEDGDGDTLQYHWLVTLAGDTVDVTAEVLGQDANALLAMNEVTFTAPDTAQTQDYLVQLTIRDGHGGEKIVNAPNIRVLPMPTANIQPSPATNTQGYARHALITLDGSNSAASEDGASISAYQWSLTRPQGSAAAISDATQSQVSFTPDLPGAYTITLDVSDTLQRSHSNSVTLTAFNKMPSATLSPSTATELNAGGSVVLKASAEDGDGDTLQYHWLVTLAGDTVDVTAEVLGQDTDALLAMNEVTFTAPETEQTRDYLVQLTVKDSHGAEKIINAPNIRVSPMPTANIQPSPATNTQGYARHALITLDGSNSAASEDGASISAYQWSLTRPQGSAAAISDATQSQVSFTPDLPGAYTITLDVSDTLQRSHSNSVTLTAFNKMPSATLSPSTATEIANGESVVIKASAEDGDGDTLQYHWLVTLAGGTVDVTAEVLGQDANALLAMNEVTFTAPDTAQMQDYLVQLTVKDSHGAEKIVNAPNIRVSPMPTANIQPSPATNTQGYARHALITLDGSNSAASEDGASISAYQWSLTRPQGSAAAISDATQSQVSFTPDLPGAYTITLDVSDTLQRSHSNSVTLTAFNKMPSATLSPSTATELNAGGSVVLKASAEDGDGDTLQYHWLVTLAGDTVDVTAEVLGQDANALLAMNEVTFTAPETAQTRDYLVQLTVKDSHGAEKIVNAPNIRVLPMPTANIQPSPATNTQGYARHALITLDGSNSAASEDGASISAYQWSLTRPQGSAAAISDATQSQVSFTPDLPGAYTITLDVSDTLQRSHSNSVTLTAFNKMPSVTLSPSTATEIANGESFVIKASAEDGDGDTLQYHWLVTLAGGTVDVTAEVLGQDANALLAMNEVTFTAPDTAQMQDYLVQLTVKDSHGAEKIINAPNIRVLPMPTANIQPSPATNTQGYARRALITLDGSNSAASEDGASISSYQWSLTRPQTSAAVISNATQSQASFRPDRPGAYTITLDVSDTLQRSHSSSVTLTAFNKIPSSALSPSTATEISSGESIVIKANAQDGDNDYFIHFWLVTLADNPVTTEVLGQDTNALLRANQVTFTAPETEQVQDYILQLTLRDGYGEDSSTEELSITVLPRLIARIEASQGDQQTEPYIQQVTLDLSASSSSLGGGTVFSSYLWELLDKPPSSRAAIASQDQVDASFTPDATGDYSIKLTVTNDRNQQHSTSLSLRVANATPRIGLLEKVGGGNTIYPNQEHLLMVLSDYRKADSLVYDWSGSDCGTIVGPIGDSSFALLTVTAAVGESCHLQLTVHDSFSPNITASEELALTVAEAIPHLQMAWRDAAGVQQRSLSLPMTGSYRIPAYFFHSDSSQNTPQQATDLWITADAINQCNGCDGPFSEGGNHYLANFGEDEQVLLLNGQLQLTLLPHTQQATAILNRQDLATIDDSSSHRAEDYYQLGDLDLGASLHAPDDTPASQRWQALGKGTGSFSGSYDGQNFFLYGFQIHETEMVNNTQLALFSKVEDGSVSNLKITGHAFVSCTTACGQVAIVSASTSNATFDNIEVWGDLRVQGGGNHSNIGGISGDHDGTLNNSKFYGLISAAGNDSVGSLVGDNDGLISNSDATAVVYGRLNVGGLVGVMKGDLETATSAGRVYGFQNIGGIIGFGNGTTDDHIQHAHSSAHVEAWVEDDSNQDSNQDFGNSSGGMVGKLFQYDVTYSSANGDVTGRADAGGLVGYLDLDCSISHSYASGTVTGTTNVGGLVGGTTAYLTNVHTSYASGSVSGENRVGGLFGYNFQNIITISYASGPALASQSFGNGLIGESLFGLTSSAYWNQDANPDSSSTDGTASSSLELQTLSTFSPQIDPGDGNSWWNFGQDSSGNWNGVWGLESTINNGYPYLICLPGQEGYTPPSPLPAHCL